MKTSIRKMIALLLVLTLVFALAMPVSAGIVYSDPTTFGKVKPAQKKKDEAKEEEKADETASDLEEKSAEPTEEVVVAEDGNNATITLSDASANLNIRAKATKNSELLGQVKHGDRVKVLGKDGKWTKVQVGDITGFVFTAYLTQDVVAQPVVDVETPTDEVEKKADAEAGKQTEVGDEPEQPAEIDYSKLKVEISSTLGSFVVPGETIHLTSKLTGFDGLSYSMQWQCDDGTGWKDIPNATKGTYSYEASADNINYKWRLNVDV